MFLDITQLGHVTTNASLDQLFVGAASTTSVTASIPTPVTVPVSTLMDTKTSLVPSPAVTAFPYSFERQVALSLPSKEAPTVASSAPTYTPVTFTIHSLSPMDVAAQVPVFYDSFVT